MSLGLLGAYDSSSGSSSENEEEEEKPQEAPALPAAPLSNPFGGGGGGATRTVKTLPRPSFMVEGTDFTKSKLPVASTSTSVFNNPFREREDRKKAVLEKHVTMTVRQEDGKTIGGKKVCWNYR